MEADPDSVVTVDLAAREVRAVRPAAARPGWPAPFEIDDYTRWRLMEGLDDISLTLRHADEITSFERERRGSWLPTAGSGSAAEILPQGGYRAFQARHAGVFKRWWLCPGAASPNFGQVRGRGYRLPCPRDLPWGNRRSDS